MNVERALVLAVVGAAGLTGLGVLGESLRAAVALGVRVDGQTPLGAATRGPGSLPLVVHAEAGLASALSDAERIAENFAEAPRGLYSKLRPDEARAEVGHAVGYWTLVFDTARRVRPRFSSAGYRRYVGRGLDVPLSPAHATEFDLLKELYRLDLWRGTGPYAQPVMGARRTGDPVRWSGTHTSIVRAIAAATRGRVTDTRRNLASAERLLTYGRRPVPDEFFERIIAVARIHYRGIPETEFERLFRPGASPRAAQVEVAANTIVDVLGRHAGVAVTPGLFALGYLADADGALNRLDDAARGYLEAAILPLLRQVTPETSGRASRTFTEEGEARTVGRIVSGDAAGALQALAQGRARKSADVPASTAEAVRFAASLFEPVEAGSARRLTPFTFDELMDLVRFDGDALARLADRPAGGAELAEVAWAVRRLDPERFPARAAEHTEKVFSEWLRTVARGDRAGFDEYAGHASRVVREVPALLREAMEDLLKAFSEEQAP